jgi:hypothetical protein
MKGEKIDFYEEARECASKLQKAYPDGDLHKKGCAIVMATLVEEEDAPKGAVYVGGDSETMINSVATMMLQDENMDALFRNAVHFADVYKQAKSKHHETN